MPRVTNPEAHLQPRHPADPQHGGVLPRTTSLFLGFGLWKGSPTIATARIHHNYELAVTTETMGSFVLPGIPRVS
jgi:hypothetical protein